MIIIKKLSKSLITFFVLLSLVISTTSVFAAEIVGRLSVHWRVRNIIVQSMLKFLLMKLIKEQKGN